MLGGRPGGLAPLPAPRRHPARPPAPAAPERAGLTRWVPLLPSPARGSAGPVGAPSTPGSARPSARGPRPRLRAALPGRPPSPFSPGAPGAPSLPSLPSRPGRPWAPWWPGEPGRPGCPGHRLGILLSSGGAEPAARRRSSRASSGLMAPAPGPDAGPLAPAGGTGVGPAFRDPPRSPPHRRRVGPHPTAKSLERNGRGRQRNGAPLDPRAQAAGRGKRPPVRPAPGLPSPSQPRSAPPDSPLPAPARRLPPSAASSGRALATGDPQRPPPRSAARAALCSPRRAPRPRPSCPLRAWPARLCSSPTPGGSPEPRRGRQGSNSWCPAGGQTAREEGEAGPDGVAGDRQRRGRCARTGPGTGSSPEQCARRRGQRVLEADGQTAGPRTQNRPAAASTQ